MDAQQIKDEANNEIARIKEEMEARLEVLRKEQQDAIEAYRERLVELRIADITAQINAAKK